MPDLGKYAVAVLTAYGASLGLLTLLVLVMVWRGRRVRAEMAEVEAGRRDGQQVGQHVGPPGGQDG